MGLARRRSRKEFVPGADGVFVYLNADEIARESALSNVAAGRVMLERLQHHVDQRDDIILETTLAGEGYLRRIPRWRRFGYVVTMYYLKPTDVEVSVQRVQRRVAAGGHNIPEAVIRQRFKRSLDRLEQVKHLVDD
jgi:predicted ABC-type ATPase